MALKFINLVKIVNIVKKEHFFLIFSLFFIIDSIQSQNHNSHTCTSPKEHVRDENEIRMFNQLNKVNAAKAAGVNAWVESIHSFAATWVSGGYDSFSIGTGATPNGANRQNIGYTQGLYITDKTIYGYSYEELRLAALSNPLGSTVFNLGQNFYLHLYNGGTDDVYGPFQFNWENLGAAANDVSVNVETQFGINGVGPFANWQQIKIMDFYNKVIPIIKTVYGPPSLNQTLNVINDGNSVGINTFYNGPNWITSSYFVNASGDLDQPRLLIHELLHGWRDNVGLSSNNLWHYDPTLSGFEEGMAEAVAVIVMDKFIEQYPNYFNDTRFNIRWGAEPGYAFDWDYDFQNHQQITGTDFWSSDQGTGVHWERYGTASAAFYKMYIEDNNIFKSFNAEYYKRMNNNHSLLTSRALITDILATVLPKVEEEQTLTWINNQRIFDCNVLPGKKVHMLSFQGADGIIDMGHDNRIQVIETQNLPGGNEWSWDVYSGGNLTQRWYQQLNNLSGTITVKRYDGTTFATKNINNNLDANGLANGNGGPHQGPCVTPNINGPGACFPTGISQFDFYTTSADPAITNGGMNDGTWYTNQGVKSSRNIYKIQNRGLYSYNISFTDQGQQITGKYYRLHGNDFINNDGVYAGIRNNNDTPVTGRMYIEQKNDAVAATADEEPTIPIVNGTVLASRVWGSVPETDVTRQAGRTDRRYSKLGKVHAIYISEDPTAADPSIPEDRSTKKIGFRNIAYGASLSGTQMFLFNVDELKEIIFTAEATTANCEGEPVDLTAENNFPTYLDTDTRITYQWEDPIGNVIANTKNYTIPSISNANTGIYKLKITFFGNTKPIIIDKMVDIGTKRWNGVVDGNWDNPMNWTPNGSIPNNTDCVVIPPATNEPVISGTNYAGFAGTLKVLSGAVLTVKSSNTIAVTDKVTVDAGGILEIENSGSLVQINDIANSGDIIYKRNSIVRNLDYTFWSSPVANFNVSNIATPNVLGPIFKWDPVFANPNGGQGYWINAAGNTMDIAKGYIVRAPSTFSPSVPTSLGGSFEGVPNNGTINASIIRGNDIDTNPHYGQNGIPITNLSDNLNLIGNPYPSSIRANHFLYNNATKILGNVRLWKHESLPSSAIQNPFYGSYGENYNPNDYLTYNLLGANCCPAIGSDLLIGSGQGFFVQMLDGPTATDNVTFDNQMRNVTYDNSLFYKGMNANLERHRLWIDVTNLSNNQFDRTLLGYIEGATMDEDNFFDSTVIPNNDAMTFYSLINNNAFTIQGRALPFDENDEVFLGIDIITQGNYTIGIGSLDGLFQQQNVYLEDMELNIVHDIKQSPYQFTSNVGKIINRFKIVYLNTTLNTTDFDLENDVTVINSNNDIKVISNNELLDSIVVYDVLGRRLANYGQINLKEFTLDDFTKNNTTLLLQIKLQNGSVVNKKMIF
ncbi:hypothetical protein FLJU110815_09270 [Flavobacterium jumunjinense]